ncbi:monodehydroascorbate reductase 5, mitochondrial isoform X1 [Amborella trichopoda]|nr:monodehydroascorbate reductase 5, mitochondrial isoform X1 [Amborella trichopoda]XP_011628912.1 monodehydroascorbate reductase 5, mitochondrial isoform X1 [Amborella trichopoda]|eukprot:XP_006828797.2 monodehydroascorbate reductase 5, mitochondrial isoform X1 [Amborella trichopoda]
MISSSALKKMAASMVISNSSAIKQGISLFCPQSPFVKQSSCRSGMSFSSFRRRTIVTASSAAFANENREFVIVGGGNAAGYAARTFVEHGLADGRLCIVSKEAVAPYERPALTKAYLFPLDKKPARLPGFHTCVGSGGERQTPEWYEKQGIEVLYEDPVTTLDTEAQTLTTASGKLLKYGSLIIATGCTAARLPEGIGGNLPGVHYIRDVADADMLISSLKKAKKVVVIGGGYIGMEVAAATVGWNLDTTVIFPDDHLMPRLFTASLARRYEDFYQENGVKFLKGMMVDKLEAGSDGRVAVVRLKNGSLVEADTVIVGIGAKPAIGPFETLGLNNSVGGIQVDSQFRTSIPGILSIGDVAAFPLKIYDRIVRVEHVDHARKSAQHCVKALLSIHTQPYDYLPYFYSRVFEYEGSSRKVWWQFFGDNVGETIEVGGFDPKIATFWLDSGRLKGVFLESGSPEEFEFLPKLARSQPVIDKAKLQSATSVEAALEVAKISLLGKDESPDD